MSEKIVTTQPCNSCVDKSRLGLVGLVKGLLYGPAAQDVVTARMEVCAACTAVDSAGDRLFRVIDGKSYCGVPRLAELLKVWRNEAREGCGCELNYKASRKEADCPRGHWGLIEQPPGAEQEPEPEPDAATTVVISPIYMPGGIAAAAAAVAGLKAEGHSGIVWSVPSTMIPLAQLFQVADVLMPMEARAGGGKSVMLTPKDGQPWPLAFGEQLGVVPVMPPVNISSGAVAWAAEAHGMERSQSVVLAPVIEEPQGANMAWPVRRWLELEDALLRRGVGVTVVDTSKDGSYTQQFRSVRHFDVPMDHLAALVARASLVIGGNESALALAAVQNTPSIAFCGPVDGSELWGWYKHATALSGAVACSPCRYRSGTGFSRFCRFQCEAVHGAALSTVLEAALAKVGA